MHAAVLFARQKNLPSLLQATPALATALDGGVRFLASFQGMDSIVTEILGTSKWRMGSTTADPRLAADC